MLYEKVDRESVEKLVSTFYASVLDDAMLAPFFIKILGKDMNGGKWYEHLRQLNEFWHLMMTGKGHYRGHPFPAHAFIGPLTREHFEQWLKLFKATVDSLFVREIADKFYEKADTLAEQFIENLGIDDEDDDY